MALRYVGPKQDTAINAKRVYTCKLLNFKPMPITYMYYNAI